MKILIAALFNITKNQKQPSNIQLGNGTNWYIYKGILLINKKEQPTDIHIDMDESIMWYAK